MRTTVQTDRAAIALNILCIFHCLALPVLAISLPFLGAIAENELIHAILAVLAIAFALSVIARAPDARSFGFLVPACLGMVLIGFALFAERFGIGEILPTVIGGLLLAFAHLRRLFAR